MSEAIKGQYEVLFELSRIDEKIHRLSLELERIPQEQARLEAAIAQRKATYDAVKMEFDAAEKASRKLELDLKEREDRIRKAESKLMEVKTNEEYAAGMKENEGLKKEKAQLEEQILGFMGHFEKAKVQLGGAEKEFKDFESAMSRDKAQLKADAEKVNALLKEQKDIQAELAKKLAPDVGDTYQKVGARTRGVPIATVANGMCMGCNVKVRAQQYNEVLGFKAIHRCSSCGRILIKPPESNTADAAANG